MTRRRCIVTAMERLEEAGYEQYEISNVAKPGRRSRHNLKYWTDGEWLGFGCGAHTTKGGVRAKNVAGTDDYIARIGNGQSAAIEVRRMSAEEQLGDALFTGLRLTDGVNLDAIRDRYGVDVWQRHSARPGGFRRCGPASARGGPPLADPPGNASCSRGDGGFRVATEYATVTAFLRRRP